MPPGRDADGTLPCPHTFEDVDQFVGAFEEMAQDLTT